MASVYSRRKKEFANGNPRSENEGRKWPAGQLARGCERRVAARCMCSVLRLTTHRSVRFCLASASPVPEAGVQFAVGSSSPPESHWLC